MNHEFDPKPVDVIIIGAGVTGLHAALELRRKGLSIRVIEARDRTGGRIHTLPPGRFSSAVETGAEFIHGSAPVVRKLLKDHNIQLTTTNAHAWEICEGKMRPAEMFSSHLEELLNKLQSLRHDMTMSEFLQRHFPGESYNDLREDVKLMVQGFDAADVDRISALSLREEWSDEDEFSGHRPVGGYSQLIDVMTREAQEAGVQFMMSSPVKEVRWKPGMVEVFSERGQFQALHVLITVPASILKSGKIHFVPSIAAHDEAFQKIATGGVVKFLVEFNSSVWDQPGSGFRQMKNLGFVFSDAPVRTWWTQRPTLPLLTGWLAGPDTFSLPDEIHLEKMAMDSLAYIFDCGRDVIVKNLRASSIVNWVKDEYAMGAYAYKTPETANALETITTPVGETLYFAGEAFTRGKEMGTVEAALNSARSAVKKLLEK